MAPRSHSKSRLVLALAVLSIFFIYNESILRSFGERESRVENHSVEKKENPSKENNDEFDEDLVKQLRSQRASEDAKSDSLPLPEPSATDTEGMTGAEKLKRFPQCSFSRRLEHPGMFDGPRIQYIHNPKSGGTSIQIAMWNYARAARGAIFYKYDSNSVSGSSTTCPKRALSSTVLAGHRGFGYCKAVETNKRGLFTFMNFRDAVSRMVSWYDYYLFQLRETRAVKTFGSMRMELNEIVKRFNATPEVEYGESLLRYSGQQQARFLCGYECMGPASHGNKRHTEEFILAGALKNLQKLDVIGLTEQLDKMIIQLRFHLPQLIPKTATAFIRDNATNKKSILDEEARAILRSWGWVDSVIYAEAKKLYMVKQRLAEKCTELFDETVLPKGAPIPEAKKEPVEPVNLELAEEENGDNDLTAADKTFDDFEPE